MTTKTENVTWYDLLDVAEGGLFVTRIKSQLWGTQQTIHFIYNPHIEDKPFQLIFKGCTKIHWEYYAEEDELNDENADVIGFDLQIDEAGKTAVLHTDLFEVIIRYAALEVERNW